jgi:hypothetical protein
MHKRMHTRPRAAAYLAGSMTPGTPASPACLYPASAAKARPRCCCGNLLFRPLLCCCCRHCRMLHRLPLPACRVPQQTARGRSHGPAGGAGLKSALHFGLLIFNLRTDELTCRTRTDRTAMLQDWCSWAGPPPRSGRHTCNLNHDVEHAVCMSRQAGCQEPPPQNTAKLGSKP